MTDVKKNLKAALKHIQPAAKPSWAKSYGCRVLVEADGAGHLLLTGDDHAGTRLAVSIDYPNTTLFSYTLPFDQLVDVTKVSGVGDKGCSVEVDAPTDKKDGAVRFLDGTLTTNLPLVPGVCEASDFPFAHIFEKNDPGMGVAFSAADLDRIRAAAKIASDDEARPILNAVFIANGQVTATDSYRAICFDLDETECPPIIVPLHILNALPADETITVHAEHLAWGGSVVLLRQGEYPNVASILNQAAAYGKSSVFDTATLRAELRALGTPQSDAQRPVVIDSEAASLTSKNGSKLSGPVTINPALDVRVAFNHAYFDSILATLDAFAAGEKATVKYQDDLKSFLFSVPGVQAILMPVRVP